MTGDPHNDPGPAPGPRRASSAPVVGAVLIALLGGGWFTLSRVVMDTAVSDAIAEAVGVVLALLVVASIIGAVASSRGRGGSHP